jgi:hypothetical protein
MSIGAIAARLYTIQTRKNLSLSSAISQVVRENLAVRFSVYSLVKAVTKSETLATLAQVKYGKKTPQEREEEQERKTARQSDIKFRRYVAGSIVALNSKINAVAEVSKQNSQLIEALYSELGNYKRQRRVNVRGSVAPRSIRIPLREKTVKGKIDKIYDDLDKIQKMTIAAKKKKSGAAQKTSTGKLPASEAGGLLSSALGALVKNPLLGVALMSGGGGAALALARYGIPALALANLPRTFDKIGGRFQGQPAFPGDPMAEQMSQAITPGMAALGTYTGGMLLTSAYQKLAGGSMSKAERVYGGTAAQLEEEKMRKRTSLTQKYQQQYYGKKGLTTPMPTMASMISPQDRIRQYYDAKLKRTKTFEGFERVKKEYIAAMEKNRARSVTKESKIDQSSTMRSRIDKMVDKKYDVAITKNFAQMQKWTKISSAVSGIAKRVPSFTAAYLAYKVAEMSNYVVERSSGKMDQREFKQNMVQSYADIATTLGPAALGAMMGGLVGTALFPGVGTATLAAVGGAVGGAFAVASDLFGDGQGETSLWLGEKLFEIFHEDRKYRPKQKDDIPPAEKPVVDSPSTSRPTSILPGPAVNMPVDAASLESATSDRDFMSEIMRVSKRFEIDPTDLLSVMAIETAGTFRPDIRNPKGTATGLLQFTEDTAKRMGTSTAALAMMTRAGQMKYVEKYFEMWNLPKGANAATIYSTVFLPGRADNFVLTRQGEKFYELNRVLDINNDGMIDKNDLYEWTNRKKRELPRLLAENVDVRTVSPPPEQPVMTQSDQKNDAATVAQINSVAAITGLGMVSEQIKSISGEMIKDRRYNQPDDPVITNPDMGKYGLA